MIPPSKLHKTSIYRGFHIAMFDDIPEGFQRVPRDLPETPSCPAPRGFLKDKILQSIHEVSVEHAVCEQDLSLVCMPAAFIIIPFIVMFQDYYSGSASIFTFFWLHSLHYITLHYITLQYSTVHCHAYTCTAHHCTNCILYVRNTYRYIRNWSELIIIDHKWS